MYSVCRTSLSSPSSLLPSQCHDCSARSVTCFLFFLWKWKTKMIKPFRIKARGCGVLSVCCVTMGSYTNSLHEKERTVENLVHSHILQPSWLPVQHEMFFFSHYKIKREEEITAIYTNFHLSVESVTLFWGWCGGGHACARVCVCVHFYNENEYHTSFCTIVCLSVSFHTCPSFSVFTKTTTGRRMESSAHSSMSYVIHTDPLLPPWVFLPYHVTSPSFKIFLLNDMCVCGWIDFCQMPLINVLNWRPSRYIFALWIPFKKQNKSWKTTRLLVGKQCSTSTGQLAAKCEQCVSEMEVYM